MNPAAERRRRIERMGARGDVDGLRRELSKARELCRDPRRTWVREAEAALEAARMAEARRNLAALQAHGYSGGPCRVMVKP